MGFNTEYAGRTTVDLAPDPVYRDCSLAIDPLEDDQHTRERYRPFLQLGNGDDWVAQLELGTALEMVRTEILNKGSDRLKILVLFGSLRRR